MQLGPAVTHLAEILNYPEPSAQIIKRFMREAGWTNKGARGRHAPHVTPEELAGLMIAMMVAESPGLAVERLEHFAKLPHEAPNHGHTFQELFATLLQKIANGTCKEAYEADYKVVIDLNLSNASIWSAADEFEPMHNFSALETAPVDVPTINLLPFYHGVERQASLRWSVLFCAAKIILAGVSDPDREISELMDEVLNA
jgi:hypothetical protein